MEYALSNDSISIKVSTAGGSFTSIEPEVESTCGRVILQRGPARRRSAFRFAEACAMVAP